MSAQTDELSRAAFGRLFRDMRPLRVINTRPVPRWKAIDAAEVRQGDRRIS
jgi:hypothetical protein